MTRPYDPYPDPDRLEDAVGRLTDPLNDPLPSQPSPPGASHGHGHQDGRQGPRSSGSGQGSPWFRPHHHATDHGPDPQQTHDQAPHGEQAYAPHGPRETYGQGDLDGYATPHSTSGDPPYPAPEPDPYPQQRPEAAVEPREGGSDAETVALRQARRDRHTQAGGTGESSEATGPAVGGRAARGAAERAARKKGGRTSREAEGRAARRKAAARARQAGLGAMASRALGEAFITTGVLLLLFVTYQLWWTNVQANQHARGEANSLERAFDDGEKGEEPEKFEPGEGFAIMYIPKLDVRVPVAEGIEKGGVLDRGMAGHYDKKSGLETAMPWDEEGNFAVAGHRNTHGEPFRYINKLNPDDEIIVETRNTYYTYKVTSRLPSTSPSNVDVISPVPEQSGFTKPGRYLTLTTCTPEFSSKYRLIVWGTMVDERPRSEGKPKALGG